MIPIGETRDGRADMTNFEMDLFDTRLDSRKNVDSHCRNSCPVPPACLPITILIVLLSLTFIVPLLNDDHGSNQSDSANSLKYERTGVCTDRCRLEFVESIPVGMSLVPRYKSTYEAWSSLLENATKSIDLVALYWNLRDNDNHSSSLQGRNIFEKIMEKGRQGVKIRIAQNSPGNGLSVDDSTYLQERGLSDVRTLNFTNLFGSGVLHTKFWIVDRKNIYIGSSNMDWKSLTQVKELGVMITNCSCLALELGKIFSIYWRVGTDGAVPSIWPVNLRTKFNSHTPINLSFDSGPALSFISNSPSEFNTKGREHDLSAIIFCMQHAAKFIRVSVMDYLPATIYLGQNNSFWPPIDNAIRDAAFRGVRVELLFSHWEHSKREMVYYLRSLIAINEALPYHHRRKRGIISIKLFRVPNSSEKIPFTRVNHSKYMVTDKAVYVGTSNWTGDYFNSTAGVGIIVERASSSGNNSIVAELDKIFERDWNSHYAFPFK